MNFDLDASFLGVNSVQSNLKLNSKNDENCESGVESGSNASTSSASLDELPHQVLFVDKPIVTAAINIRPQISCSKNIDLKDQPLSIDLIVMFRGHLPMLNPVPFDRNERTRLMKMYAKRLQKDPKARFLKMNISEKGIKLFDLNQPTTLLLEIDGNTLNLIKQSRKDTAFFYFVTLNAKFNDSPLVLKSGPSSEAPEHYSGYDCFVFHGTATRTADRAHRLIGQFVEKNCVDAKPKAGFFNLVAASTNSIGSNAIISSVPSIIPDTTFEQQHETKAIISPPASEKVMPEEKEASFGTSDVLLCDFSVSESTNSPLSMFDYLAPSSPDNNSIKSAPVKHEMDLLGDLSTPAPQKDNIFAQQHFNYSKHMSNTFGMQAQPNMAPCSQPHSLRSPMQDKQFVHSVGMAPSLLCDLKPHSSRPVMKNPFEATQPMAPLALPNIPAPLKPETNTFSVAVPSALQNVTTNPFGGPLNQVNTLNSYPQYPNSMSNPFAAPSGQSHKSFDTDFNDFLSQTVKSHFNSSDKPFNNLL